MKELFAIPIANDINSKRRLMYLLLYTAAVTVPLVDTIVFWLVLYRSNPRSEQSHHTFFRSALASRLPYAINKAFPNKSLETFVLVNVNAMTSFIALLEILLLNTIPKQKVCSAT